MAHTFDTETYAEDAACAAEARAAFVAHEAAQEAFEDDGLDLSDADWAAGGELDADEDLLALDDGACPCCMESLGDDAVEVRTTSGMSRMCPECFEELDGHGPAEQVSRERRIEVIQTVLGPVELYAEDETLPAPWAAVLGRLAAEDPTRAARARELLRGVNIIGRTETEARAWVTSRSGRNYITVAHASGRTLCNCADVHRKSTSCKHGLALLSVLADAA